MSTTSSPSSIDDRMALIRDNIRQLIEHAVGYWMKSDRRAVALSAEKKKADEVFTGMGCMK